MADVFAARGAQDRMADGTPSYRKLHAIDDHQECGVFGCRRVSLTTVQMRQSDTMVQMRVCKDHAEQLVGSRFSYR